MVGAGILILPTYMAAFGAWSILGWCLGAAIMSSLAVIFARLSRTYRGSTLVNCIALNFGPIAGFLATFGYVVAMTFSGSRVAMTLGDYAMPLLHNLNFDLPAWMIGFGVIALLTFINIASYGSSAILLTILTILKILFFVVIGVVGCGRYATYVPTFGSSCDIIGSAAISIFAFLGLEFAFIGSSDVKNAEVIIPRATYLGLFLSTLLFISVHCAVLFILPNPASSQRPVYDAVLLLFGNNFAYIFAVFAILSCMATINGLMIVIAKSLSNATTQKWIKQVDLAMTTDQGFPFVGAIAFCLLSFFIMQMPVVIPYMCSAANVLVGLIYLLAVLVDIKGSSLDLFNAVAFISSMIIIFGNLNLGMFALVVMTYFVGYVIKMMDDTR
jgi:APA family basic amino acid/polyamine antiporter